MTELEKFQKMPIDKLTTQFVRILSCERCFCRDICEEVKATGGADDNAPCPVAIRRFLESEVKDDTERK